MHKIIADKQIRVKSKMGAFEILDLATRETGLNQRLNEMNPRLRTINSEEYIATYQF